MNTRLVSSAIDRGFEGHWALVTFKLFRTRMLVGFVTIKMGFGSSAEVTLFTPNWAFKSVEAEKVPVQRVNNLVAKWTGFRERFNCIRCHGNEILVDQFFGYSCTGFRHFTGQFQDDVAAPLKSV